MGVKAWGIYVTFPVTENNTSPSYFPKEFDYTFPINNHFLYNLDHFRVFWPGLHLVHHVLWEGIMHSSQEFTQKYVHKISRS
jgi:hypothetical protein